MTWFLLFCKVTGHYPERISVVSFSFKKDRFENLHRVAVRWCEYDFLATLEFRSLITQLLHARQYLSHYVGAVGRQTSSHSLELIRGTLGSCKLFESRAGQQDFDFSLYLQVSFGEIDLRIDFDLLPDRPDHFDYVGILWLTERGLVQFCNIDARLRSTMT